MNGEGRFLDHLLVPALEAALALVAGRPHVAVRITEHLDLDVTRLLDKLLDEDAVVAEARLARLVAAGLLKPSNADACR